MFNPIRATLQLPEPSEALPDPPQSSQDFARWLNVWGPRWSHLIHVVNRRTIRIMDVAFATEIHCVMIFLRG